MRFSPHHCGPPNSANGGYACGVTAGELDPGCVEVTLAAPPPLDRDLSLVVVDGEARLSDGATEIAVARPADPDFFAVPDPVSNEEAVAASRGFDVDEYRRTHAYPTCFTCGPDREPGEGLRIFPAPTERDGLCAWPWTVPEVVFDDGVMDPAIIWAALDCPSGLSWFGPASDVGPIVLGRMRALVHRTAAPGEQLVVAGWTGERRGRKLGAGSAVWSTNGETLAVARSTWIELTEDQRAAFGARG